MASLTKRVGRAMDDPEHDFLDVAEAWFMSSKIEIIDGELFCHDRRGYLYAEDVEGLLEAIYDPF